MELQFPKIPCAWLRTGAGDTKNLEQTLEVKLTDDLPDIGKVLCGWGQALVRSKQWGQDSIGVTGGVMAWVMYAPEDGSEIRSVECWIPFQGRWDIPERERDGVILANCYLQGVDARSLSARKLMVRVNVALCAQAMTQAHMELCESGELPEDVQVRKERHSLLLPREAGEKLVELEDSLSLPSGLVPEKLLRYCLHPMVTDCKLMADRAVFRGTAMGHALLRDAQGQLHPWNFDLPFSQYTELDREYEPQAQLQVSVVPTGLEMELGEDGNLHLKGSLIAQYLVYEPRELELITDAYSTQRQLTPQVENITVPIVSKLDYGAWQASGESAVPLSQVLDQSFLLRAPTALDFGGEPSGELEGSWQILGIDQADALRCENIPWKASWAFPSQTRPQLWAWQASHCEAAPGGVPSVAVGAGAVVSQEKPLSMITGLTLGEDRALKEDRPSMILRRADGEPLWEMAKSNATTVEKIMEANGLTQEPEKGSWLLIPVP